MPSSSSVILTAAVAAATACCGTDALHFRSGSTGDFGLGVQRLKYRERNLQLESPFGSRAANPCGNVTTNYFAEAVKDNFAAASQQEHWDAPGQRYFLNDQYWGGPGSPIFVYIGGEGPESCGTLQPGVLLMSQLAEKHSALMVDIEHRYYGESYPTANDMSNEHLAAYLTSEQALADLARLVSKIVKDKKAESSKVISFGGSYPGNLAAWFRLKYPHITDASVASSAPLRAKTNFLEYMEVVTDALRFWWPTDDACNSAVKEATSQLAKYADQGPGSAGYAQLEKDFMTCAPLQSIKDVHVLFSDLMGNIQGTVQYNRESSRALNVTDICAALTQPESSAYDNFVALSNNFTQQFFDASEYGDDEEACEDSSWDNLVAYTANATRDETNNMRPWTYQTCNEFGYFQTADSSATPWINIKSYINGSFYLDLCEAAFGGLANAPDTDNTNTHYGSDGIAGTDIMFPNGSLDPWHVLGVYGQAPLPQSSEVPNFINGTAHCADMRAFQPSTHAKPSPLQQGQLKVIGQVSAWLAQ